MFFLALIYLAFISLGLPDSLLGSAWPVINAELSVPVGHAGYISIVVSCGTIVSSIFSHRVIRKIGTGKVLVISVSMTAAALLGFYFSPWFFLFIIFAVPLGLGAGAVDAALNEFVAEHYAAKHMNWLHCFWGVGAMLGPLLMSALLNTGHGWRSGYLSISVIQFGLVVLLAFSLPMWKKRENPLQPLPVQAGQAPAKQGLFAAFKVKGAALAMPAFFLYTTVESTVGLWGASYLVGARGFAPESAAGWVSLFFLGITAGRAISGFISMKLSNQTLIRGGIIVLVCGIVLMLLPLPDIFAVVAIGVIGLGLAPIFPSMLHQTPLYFGRDRAQAAMGLQMACAYTGTTIMPPLFGQLFSRVSFDLMPYALLICGAALFIFTLCLPLRFKNAKI
jgi:fucose permease